MTVKTHCAQTETHRGNKEKRESERGEREKRERERRTSEENYKELDELNASEEVWLQQPHLYIKQKSQYYQKHVHFVKN